jgi:hypothetical protein
MVKKKTSVVLPGGIAGLVKEAQGNIVRQPQPVEEPVTQTQKGGGAAKGGTNEKPSAPKAEKVGGGAKSTARPASGKQESRGGESRQSRKADDEQIYPIGKILNADETWDLFLDLARDYKQKQSKIATIYIDEDLKKVLDRIRSAGDLKLSTTAIVSSIVARFIYDHADQIKNLIYKDNGLII